MLYTKKVIDLAASYIGYFEWSKRISEEKYVFLRTDAPEELKEIMYKAHCGMAPDDFKFETAYNIMCAIAHSNEKDILEEMNLDQFVGIYSCALATWLSSNIERFGYCDEAVSSGMVGQDATTEQRLQAGQYGEINEIFNVILGELDRIVDLRSQQEFAEELGFSSDFSELN